MKMLSRIAGVGLGLFLVGCSAPSSGGSTNSTEPSAGRTKIYLPNNEKFGLNEKSIFDLVEREGTFGDVDSLVRIILSQREVDQPKPLSAPFGPKSLGPIASAGNSGRLEDYFLGARIVGSTVVMNFESGAMAYLNGTVSMQAIVKGTIMKTVKMHYPVVQDVSWVIDGKVVNDWDA